MSKRPREDKSERKYVGDIPPRALLKLWKDIQPKWEEVAMYLNLMPSQVTRMLDSGDREKEKHALELLVILSNRSTTIDELVEAIVVVFQHKNDVVVRTICVDMCPGWVREE